MKIRTDFVTNSSSSSFIVEVSDENPDVFTLAKKMIEFRDFDDDDRLKERIDNCDHDPDTAITFSSINYETYIMREDNVFKVDTCNNHDWYDILEIINDRQDVEYEINEFVGLKIYIPGLDKIVEVTEDKCPKHNYHNVWNVLNDEGEVITKTCPSCTFW